LNKGNNKKKKELYQLIVSLPLSNQKDDFMESYNKIIKSKYLSGDSKSYLKNKFNKKDRWVKAFMKSKFCGGMCTTSRIESKHRVFKRFLNSSTKLSELFKVIKIIENQEINSFTNEIVKLNKKPSSV